MMDQEIDSSDSRQRPMLAPSRLTAEGRLNFRRAVLDELEQAVHAGFLVVELDLGATVEIDASGLGVLVLLQKRARERGIPIRLHRVPNVVAQLFDATRVGSHFEIVRL